MLMGYGGDHNGLVFRVFEDAIDDGADRGADGDDVVRLREDGGGGWGVQRNVKWDGMGCRN